MKNIMKFLLIVLCIFTVSLQAVSERPFSRQTFNELLSYDLFDAIERNDVMMVKKLLAQGANPNAKYAGKTALMVALYKANGYETMILQELLKNGADANLVDESLMSPLEYATKYQKDPKILNLLIQYGASITPRTSSCYTPGEAEPEENPYEEAEKEMQEWEILPTKEEIEQEEAEAAKKASLWTGVKYYFGIK